jgi:hypothetical protein
MADTARNLSDLQTLLANNTAKDISAQDLRDFLISAYGHNWLDAVSGNTTLTDSHEIVNVDSSGGNVAISLPTAVGRGKKLYTVKKTDTGGNWVSIVPNGAETIDGHVIEYLGFPGATLKMISDNANWHILTPGRELHKLLFAGTADSTFNNSSAEVSVMPTGLGIKTLPPNFFRVGRDVRIIIKGYINVTGTPTITWRQRLNAVQILASAAITLAAVTNNFFRLETVLRARSIGVGGTIHGQGSFAYGGGSGNEFGLVTTAPISLDTTINQPIDVSAQFNAASSSNLINVTDIEIQYAA